MAHNTRFDADAAAAARSLLATLEDEHGPGVLASLLAAALAASDSENRAAAAPEDTDADLPTFDRGWLAAFADADEFWACLPPDVATRFDPDSCEIG